MENIFNFLSQMNWWQWMSFGVALLSIELMFPGLLMLWFGLGAIIVSFFVYILNVDGIIPVLLFIVTGLLASFFGYKYQKNNKRQTLNSIKENFIGKTLVLKNSMEDGVGREKIQNSYWTLKGPNLEKGEIALITGIDGNSFFIEKVR